MNLDKLKKEYIGKKLISIISLDLKDSYIISALKRITKDEYDHSVNNAQLLLFENNKALVFIDLDCDGYRSGDWFLANIEQVLDKGYTTGIKEINSIVSNIEYFENVNGVPESYSSDTNCVLITTDEYVIKLGQSNVSDYYPSNFFSVEECKSFALGKSELIDFKEGATSKEKE